MAEPALQEGRCGPLHWAVCASAYPGEMRSGDTFLVQETRAGVLVAVVDGLGHGDEAADVAERALASLRRTAEQPLERSFIVCHEALRRSRGVVMTLAAIDVGRSSLSWVAVGNVDAAVMRSGREGKAAQRWLVPLRGGVVGDRLPVLREATVPLVAGDTLIAATDGMSTAFLDGIDLFSEADDLSKRLHRGHARTDDDALVLVARWLTSPPSS